VRSRSEETVFKPHETRLVSALFSDSAAPSVGMSDLENRFHRSLPGIHDAVFRTLQDRRCYLSRSDKVKQAYWTAGPFVMLAGAGGGVMLAQYLGRQELPWILAAMLSGLIVLGFSWIMPARTIHGTRTLEKVLGFEESHPGRSQSVLARDQDTGAVREVSPLRPGTGCRAELGARV
jgi:hypothetical protein